MFFGQSSPGLAGGPGGIRNKDSGKATVVSVACGVAEGRAHVGGGCRVRYSRGQERLTNAANVVVPHGIRSPTVIARNVRVPDKVSADNCWSGLR